MPPLSSKHWPDFTWVIIITSMSSQRINHEINYISYLKLYFKHANPHATTEFQTLAIFLTDYYTTGK